MANSGTVDQRSRRRTRTLRLVLHVVVMILGVVGVSLSIVAMVLVAGNSEKYKDKVGGHGAAIASVIWMMVTTILIFVSGLQGIEITMRNGLGRWREHCFVFVAVVVLVDLGILIFVALLAVSSAFWITYMIAVFAMELWVLGLRTCCKPMEVDMVATELPIANPQAGAVDRELMYSVDMSRQAYPPTSHDSSDLKSPYAGHL